VRPGTVTSLDSERIQGHGRLAMPGLVNAHTHGHGALSKGVGDRWNLELLLNAAPWIGGRRNDQDKYLSALLNAAEMALKGCTACYDLCFEFPAPTLDGLAAVAQAYADVGIRAVVAPMVADLTFYQSVPGLLASLPHTVRGRVEAMRMGPADATLQAIDAAARAWRYPADRIRLAVAPTIPLHCTEAFLTGCRDLARKHGLSMQMHLGEAKYQAVSGIRRYGRSLTAALDAFGLLGPRFSAAHAVWLDDADIARLADRGAQVAHNPGSNLRLGSGIAPIRAMLNRGVAVGVGTDGSSCSDNQNMFEAMRLAAYVSRGVNRPVDEWVGAAEALRMATEGSARVLGFDTLIGRLARGYKADIVLLDLGHINLVPLNDPTNQIVNAEDGGAVHTVMVGGRIIVENRRLVALDTARLAAEAEAAVERLREANAPARAFAERLAPLVAGFCRGLAEEPYPPTRPVCRHVPAD
jgi:guanine deaminase